VKKSFILILWFNVYRRCYTVGINKRINNEVIPNP